MISRTKSWLMVTENIVMNVSILQNAQDAEYEKKHLTNQLSKLQ